MIMLVSQERQGLSWTHELMGGPLFSQQIVGRLIVVLWDYISEEKVVRKRL